MVTMKCIICFQKMSNKFTVRPNCRCTVKQPVCKRCYLQAVTKLNIECSMCLQPHTRRYNQYLLHNTYSFMILMLLVNCIIHPPIMWLLETKGWIGFVSYIVGSMFVTLFIIIPLYIVASLELLIVNLLERFHLWRTGIHN